MMRNRWLTIAMVFSMTVTFNGDWSSPASAYSRPGSTNLVEIPKGSSLVGGGCQTASARLYSVSSSSDGRYLAFSSSSDEIVSGDNNQAADVFVYDRYRKTFERVSIATDGSQAIYLNPGDSCSNYVSISADGRYVAFDSSAINLVPTPGGLPGNAGDTNLVPDIFVHDRRSGETERVNLSTAGDESRGVPNALFVSISANGRFVTWGSAAANLVPDDNNQVMDVFVRDLETDTTERISLGEEGLEANGHSGTPSISATGRYVVFYSDADNVTPGDINRQRDVFIRDRRTDETEVVSTASDGSMNRPDPFAGSHAARGPAVSRNGRYVVFSNTGGQLVPAAHRLMNGVYVRDRLKGRTELVSVTSYGGYPDSDPNFGGIGAWISEDGRYVFYGGESGLVPGMEQTEGTSFLYRNDRHMGTTELVSMAWDGVPASDGSFNANPGTTSIATGGRLVFFQSDATNLIPGDDGDFDLFLRDLGPKLGPGEIGDNKPSHRDDDQDHLICITADLCIPPGGALSVSDEVGEPPSMALGADLIGARIVHRPGSNDLFVYLELEDVPSLNLTGATLVDGPLLTFYGMAFEVNGRRYEVRASSLLGGTFGLFDCSAGELCSRIANLQGGLGTTGERVVFSVPSGLIGLSRGGHLRRPTAFTAVGIDQGEMIRRLDQVRIR